MSWLLWMIPLSLLGPLMSITFVTTPAERFKGHWLVELLALGIAIGSYFCMWEHQVTAGGTGVENLIWSMSYAVPTFIVGLLLVQAVLFSVNLLRWIPAGEHH